jgi:hypothetical protein
MKILKASLFLLFVCTAMPAQNSSRVLCKGSPVPEGFVVSGETLSSSCNGTAWIIKRKPGAPSALNRFNSVAPESLSLAEPNETIAPGQCDSFQQTIKNTYNFNPARLSDTERKNQSARMDVFWNQVMRSRATLLPCLRKALKEDSSTSFFAIDGSNLLVEVDSSDASKALQVRKFTEANLDGADLEYWVKTMALRGVEGFDTSAAGAKWLAYPNAKYNLSLHGGFPVGSFIGAVFIFGSMEENLATPTLLKIVNNIGHPHRDDALAILMSQATPASFRALKEVKTEGLPAGTDKYIRELLENPNLLKPRANPKLTRAEQVIAFQGIINGDYSAFREMVMKAPDGEVDAVAALLPEDIPLVRRARRASISRCNQHALSDYASFTKILWAMTWKIETGK